MTDLTLDTRIRDAELSVRTANLLCKQFGENVTFRSFVDPGPPRSEIVTLLGRKGYKEFHEVVDYAIFNTRAAPAAAPTKTLRDEFAMAALTGLLASLGSDPGFDVCDDAYVIADRMMELRAK